MPQDPFIFAPPTSTDMLTNDIKIYRSKVLKFSPQVFQQKIRNRSTQHHGAKHSHHEDLSAHMAFTVPLLKVEKQVKVLSIDAIDGTEVGRLNKAAMQGELRHEIWLRDDLTACEERFTLAHEQMHVRDNNRIVRNLHKTVRHDAAFPVTFFSDVTASEMLRNLETMAKLAQQLFERSSQERAKFLDRPGPNGDHAKRLKLIKEHCGHGVVTFASGLRAKYLRRGDSGPEVRQVQLALCYVAAKDFDFGGMIYPDGMFGPKTAQAVREFQKKYCRPVDGIVGPKTRKALQLG